uniref:Uncharacterized protein n=1 Tax=Eptatretus burgeri TaxID=7764 RepID=A0A8C4R7U5_EPTBU
MSPVAVVMRKFMRVLDGLTASAQTPSRTEVETFPETLTSEHFQMCKTVRHGFPHQPTALAFDTVQKILAIGTKSGALRLLGRPGVDCHCQHESNSPVILLQFLVNEVIALSFSSTQHASSSSPMALPLPNPFSIGLFNVPI